MERLSPQQKLGVQTKVMMNIELLLEGARGARNKDFLMTQSKFEKKCQKEVNAVLRHTLPILLRTSPGEIFLFSKGELLHLKILTVPEGLENAVAYPLGLQNNQIPELKSFQIPKASPNPLTSSQPGLGTTPVALIWREGFQLHLALGDTVYTIRFV